MSVPSVERTTPTDATDREPPSAANRDRTGLLAALVGIPLLAAFLLAAFAWPAANIAPRDVPIGLSGPPPAVAGIEDRLSEDGAFDVTVYEDVTAAESAIADREIYGALVISAEGAELLTATAASPAVAQLLTEVARGIGESQGIVPTVRDVVPADPSDPRGSGVAVMVFPMVILGMALGAMSALIAGSRRVRLGMLTVGSLMAGLTAVLVVQGWLGLIGGDWWLNAGVLALTVGAISATAAGLSIVIGSPGIGIAAILMVLLGNPLSGAASSAELLPAP